MSSGILTFSDVAFAFDSARQPILARASLQFPAGWTGIVGANGAGKSTLLRLACGQLRPTAGRIHLCGDALYCAQRTDEPPDGLASMLSDGDADACRLRGRLRVEAAWLDRWPTLSHGERKRTQLAVALWRRPAVLAVDEPTNHVDAEARDLILDGLFAFDGVGLLVSHDRGLLDTLCTQCVFLTPPQVRQRPGSYTDAATQAQLEQETQREQFRQATAESRRLERESQLRREEASRMLKRRSKRGLALWDHDTRYRKNLARVTGKDGVGGKVRRQLLGRLDQARKRTEASRIAGPPRLGIWMAGGFSKRDVLFSLPAGSLPLGVGRALTFPWITMTPRERIAVTGPNGAGKSTLVRHLHERLALPAERVVYVPQELDAAESSRILDAVRRLPRELLGQAMTIVSCLGSRPDRLLESESPSPGEIRKLLLARGIAMEPHLIVLDEPTNHLDLPSIECLERALAGCPCALLLVSHDERFLRSLTTRRWELRWIERRGERHSAHLFDLR